MVLLGAVSSLLAGCALFPGSGALLSDRECMTRVMYFESNRSSEDGMVAVGTTVMNRLETAGFPKTVCGVVGQPGQYASGVLSKSMNPREAERIAHVADAVLAGERHPDVGRAMYFHTAGLTFPYRNMHYVAVAGGNAFYEKISARQIAAEAAAEPIMAVPQSVIAPHRPQSIDDLLTSFDSARPIGRQIAAESIPFPAPPNE